MRYIVVERFRPGATPRIYERFRERGRMLPRGLLCVESWVSEDLTRCYQLMESDTPDLFDDWIREWDDLIDFEIVPVISSAEAAARA